MAGAWAQEPLQQIPPDLAETLLRLKAECSGPGTQKDKRYHVALRTARRYGWTVAALAKMDGRAPEAMAQLIHRAQKHPRQDMTGIEIPWAPRTKGYSPNQPPPVNLVKVVGITRTNRLRRLRAQSMFFRGQCAADHPARIAARELAAELYELIFVEGHPITRVASDLLLSQTNTVSNRLRAQGYPGTWEEYEQLQQQGQDRKGQLTLAA